MTDAGFAITLNTAVMDQIIQTLPGGLSAALSGAAEEIVSEIVESFGTSPPGEAYSRNGVTHIASQPGYPPNVDTGALRASIQHEPSGDLEETITVGEEYGEYLEFGTVDIAPRPFFTPVLERWRNGEFMRYMQDVGLPG